MNEDNINDKRLIISSEKVFALLPDLMGTIPKTEFVCTWKDEEGNYHIIEETIYKRK